MSSLTIGSMDYHKSVVGKIRDKVARSNDRARGYERVNCLDDAVCKMLMEWGNTQAYSLPDEQALSLYKIMKQTQECPLWERNWKIAKAVVDLEAIKRDGFEDDNESNIT